MFFSVIGPNLPPCVTEDAPLHRLCSSSSPLLLFRISSLLSSFIFLLPPPSFPLPSSFIFSTSTTSFILPPPCLSLSSFPLPSPSFLPPPSVLHPFPPATFSQLPLSSHLLPSFHCPSSRFLAHFPDSLTLAHLARTPKKRKKRRAYTFE